MGTSDGRYALFYRRGHRDHYLKNGQTLCSHNVRTPDDPDADNVKPLTEVTGREWKLLAGRQSGPSKLCILCRGIANRNELISGEVPGEVPEFPCPECGKAAFRIISIMGMGYVEHEDEERHQFDIEIYEQWRRGGDPDEMES